MDSKIFLKKYGSKTSSNTSEGLNVELNGRRKLLPLNDVSEVISQYDVYTSERNKCNIIRLTCQVNPICTNVLFNDITEIVKNEGSSNIVFINYGLNSRSGDSTDFKGVISKPVNKMTFWSGSSMLYESFDTDLSGKSSQAKLEKVISNKVFPNGELLSSSILHPTNSIRDTQLSNIGFVYHCGKDFLNNHLIRSNTFKTVCKLVNSTSGTDNKYDAFNTIADVMRDVSGNKVIEKIPFPIAAPINDHVKFTALHLYEYDDILPFNEAIESKIISKHNGWIGFYNKSKIKSYSSFSEGAEMGIERPLMYMNGGDFVDMYPSRDLYSFVPKYNEYRHRLEKNWNYCITYPSSSYTPSNESDVFSDIIETNDGLGALKAIYFDENTKSDNGTSQIVIYSISKHGLNVGDRVNIYKTYESEQYWVIDTDGVRISDIFTNENDANNELERLRLIYAETETDCEGNKLPNPSNVASATTSIVNERILENIEVTEIADDYIFVVPKVDTQISKTWIDVDDVDGDDNLNWVISGETVIDKDNNIYYVVNNQYINIDKSAQRLSYKRVIGGVESDYYVRIFSKLPNFKFASGDTSNEYALYKNNEEIIRQYRDVKYDFENHISRMAFAKNIYSDEMGELVFTDDIDVSNIHDNLGRPLSQLYLTFIKNNKGYKEWYGYDYDGANSWTREEVRDESIEYSHAFGKVTCGIETSYESRVNDSINSIRTICNDETSKHGNGYSMGVIRNQGKDENEWESLKYNTSNGKTVMVSDYEIMYDFDTQFYGDLCSYNSYEAMERHISYIMNRFNTAQRESSLSSSKEYFNNFNYDEIRYDDYDAEPYKIEQNTFYNTETSITNDSQKANNKLEGYYYNPHYEIKIKTFGKLNTMMPKFLTIRQIKHISGYTYSIVTLQPHYLTAGDKSVLYDTISEKYYTLTTIKGEHDSSKVFTCSVSVYDKETETEIYDAAGSPIGNVSTNNYNTATNLRMFKLFKVDNLGCPDYAKVMKDGSCRIAWRDAINNGFDKNDDSVEEYPFTNGAFYVNKRIDIFVRRQDPHNEYSLYSSVDIKGEYTDIEDENIYVKEAEIEC